MTTKDFLSFCLEQGRCAPVELSEGKPESRRTDFIARLRTVIIQELNMSKRNLRQIQSSMIGSHDHSST